MIVIINKKKFKEKEGQTILEVAKKRGIDIPSLCYHPDIKVKGTCRICTVKIKGKKGLYTACSTKIEDGMEITTEDNEINKARRINLELLFSQHREECNDCVWMNNCNLLQIAKKLKVKINKYSDRKDNFPCYNFGHSLIFDSSKCIDCRNCLDVCKVKHLELKEDGHLYKILPSKKNKCIYCGQCIVHCPGGAFEGKGEFEDIEKPFNQKKPLVFQIAPSIRVSLGYSVEKIASALKEIGAYKVFDVSSGADITTIEEAKELKERIRDKKLPLLTSCCPAWVKFVETYRPELIPNLTTVKSPHIISGGIIKEILKEDVFLVSIMPCVSKKEEIEKKELMIKGKKVVDLVITTRDLQRIIEKRGIDMDKIKPLKLDSPLGNPSGGGIIYGASGGVMESALREVYNRKEIKEVRGREGIREFSIGKIKTAVIHGIDNFMKIDVNDYHYIEVMACPGGCIGGGGQPIPTDKKIRKKRADSLYLIDKKKGSFSPEIKKIYKELGRKIKKISYLD